mgnify:CR=1 FL=1
MVFSSGWGVGGLNDISRWGRERQHRSLAAFTVAFFAMQVCHYDNTRHWNAAVGSGDADLRSGALLPAAVRVPIVQFSINIANFIIFF